MLARCNNPRHQEFCRYGARGIYVCDEWLDFWSFVSWVESTYEVEKTIDRIDNDGPTPQQIAAGLLLKSGKPTLGLLKVRYVQ